MNSRVFLTSVQAIVFAAFSTMAVAAAAKPIEVFTICAGEHPHVCSDSTYHIPCGSSPRPTAERVCTVYGENGAQRVREYSLSDPKIVDGNNCGYHRWTVKCVGD